MAGGLHLASIGTGGIMRREPQLLAVCLAVLLGACGRNDHDSAPQAHRYAAQLARTSHGIAHIRAANFRGLGYGLAYAYAQHNVCMFADSLLTVRGERSRFFGPGAPATASRNGEYGAASDYMALKNEDSDFFFRGYLDPAALKAGYAAGAPEVRELLDGYVAGYNRYLRDHAGQLPAACRGAPWVRPMTVEDMHLVLAEKALHASGQVFAQEIVDAARTPGTPFQARPARGNAGTSFMRDRLARLTREQLGSNALAVGKDLSANGRGLLLGSPHYPWTSTDRFYQMHLTVPGSYDAMGVILGGIPLIVIGFNKDLAWTHTVTAAVHFTTFQLALDGTDPDASTYLYDGRPVKMTRRTVEVASLQADGSLTTSSRIFYFSQQGAVMVKPEAGIGWTRSSAIVLADPNRNNTRLLEQWLGIGRAASVKELKGALDRTVGLPWVNTIAADRDGGTLFADASVVPHVGGERFASDCLRVAALLAFDGARATCGWGGDAGAPAGVFSPANGPWMMRTDYVGNSNDSYWLSNARALLTGPYSPLYGPTAQAQMLRTRIGFKQVEEAIARKTPFTVATLQELAFANRVYAAELVLPAFLPQCQAAPDATVRAACAALAAWDRRADVNSRGAVLFREFWNLASALPNKWSTPFDPRDPVNTPAGLHFSAVPAMLDALRQAAQRLAAHGIAFDAALGDYQMEIRNGAMVPLHGAIGDIDGSYNSIHMATGLEAGAYRNVEWGTSYVQTVGFDSTGPVAQALLLYGQSVDPASPYYSDQIGLYSQKTWPVLPFTEAQVKADPHFTSIALSE
jgi:acyl-homoserine-lactone acylase